MKKKYDVVGMTCSACSAHVDKAVRGLDGVDDVNVNLLQNSMTVEFDENKLSESQIFEAVDKAGYKAQNIGEKQVSNVQENENEHKKAPKSAGTDFGAGCKRIRSSCVS